MRTLLAVLILGFLCHSKELNMPIDVYSLKMKYGKLSTSGIVPTKEVKNLSVCKKYKRIGQYILLSENPSQHDIYIGRIIVGNNSSRWMYDNKEDELLELRLEKEMIGFYASGWFFF